MPTLKANGAEFYYELHGEGQPVILIGGYACDHTAWDPVLKLLSPHFQVLVFDNRGSGQTKDSGGPLSAQLMADDAMALSDALKLSRPHVFGHSMGGTIALDVGSRYSYRIGKLGILASTSKWREAMLRGVKSSLDLRQKGVDFNLVIDSAVPWLFGESFFRSQTKLADFKKGILENPFPQSIEDQVRHFAVLKHYDGRSQLASITTPTLVLYAKEDVVSLPYESAYLARSISGAELAECEGGHVCLAEVPDQVARIVTGFLKK